MLRNRYRILRPLGHGGMAAVFEVEDALAGNARLALKALHTDDTALIASLRAEFRVLATLRHPALGQVHDFGRLPPGTELAGRDAGGFFFTRELVPGRDLGEEIAARGREPGRIAGLAASAARALDILHRAGMRHGDFKPKNAIVEPGGRLRLIDFGLAGRETDRRAGGTLAYMAPELLRGELADRRADLYALGVSLFELVTGELPSGDRTGAALVDWHLSARRPDVRAARPELPRDLADAIARLCAADARDRFPTAAEAAAALAATAARLGVPLAPDGDEVAVLPALAMPAVAALEHAFDRRRRGERAGAVIEVVGDPGSGRSTALTELAWRAQLAGAEVVRAVAGVGPAGAFGSCLEQLAALAGTEPPRAGGGAPVRHWAQVARWLDERSRAWPIVVVIDDIDFADAGSQGQVGYLASAPPSPGAWVVAVARRADGPAIPGAASVALSPLRLDDVAELLAAAAGRRDRRLAERVLAHTGGNLLDVAHAVSTLAAHRALPDELPPRLEQAIARDVAALSAAERAVCAALAVLDRRAGAERIGEIAGDPAAADHLRRLAGRGLVREIAGSWWFARPATARSIARDLSPERREALHAAAAAALARDVDADPAERAHHRIRTGEALDPAAIELVGRAVSRHRDRGDPAAAVALGVGALAAGAALPVELRLELGELARLAGDPALAESLLEPVAAGADAAAAHRALLEIARAADGAGQLARAEAAWRQVIERGDPARSAVAARELSRSWIRHGRFDDAIELVERARQAPGGALAGDHLRAAAAYARGVLGQDPEAAGTLAEVAAAARAAGDHELCEAAQSFGALLAYRAGDYRRAGQLYRDAIAAAETVGDVARAATLRLNLGALTFLLGDYAASHDNYSAAVGVLSAAGAATNAAIARKNLGHLLIELGELEQAKAMLVAARDAAVEIGLTLHEIGIDALLGIAAWRAGDLPAARTMLERAQARFEDTGDARKSSDNALDLAELELDAAGLDTAGHGAGISDTGALGAAARWLACAGAIAATRDDRARRARFHALSADLASRGADAGTARRELDALAHAIDELVEQGARHLVWDLHRIAASALARLGHPGDATEHRQRAVGHLEAIARPLSPSQRIAFWHDRRRRDLRASGTATAVEVGAAGDARHVDQLHRLLDIYRRLGSETDLARLLDLVMDTAIELTSVRRGFLLLARPDGHLETAVARNLPAAALGALARVDSDPGGTAPDALPYSRSIAQRVFETGEPVISLDAASDPRFDLAGSVHALAIERVLCLPVHARGRIAGVLYLEGKPFRGAVDDPRLLMTFGDQVGAALDAARMRAELARRADELETARAEIEGLLAERTELLDRRTEELAIARRDLSAVNRKLLGAPATYGIVGRSPAMGRVFDLIARVAAADVPVLVLGESGTGKELVARAIHVNGPRRDAPLVAVNCGGLPESLLESELFGHVRGAFTGADRTRRGMFEAAGGGTLFLDEVGEMPARMQASLLRALQHKVVRRVGDTRDIPVDVRFVAATHRPLADLVAAGQFREDLFYRLHVVTIEVPPLRDRREDLPLLCEHFLAAIAERTGLPRKQIARRAMARLAALPWPGNVRQLEHALTHACVLADGDLLDLAEFGDLLADRPAAVATATATASRRDRERDRILEALESVNWNKSRAARLLQMPRRTFYRRLEEYDIA